MNAILIGTGRIISTIEITEPIYKCLQNAIGGYIEIVRPKGLNNSFCMIVDEEGLIKQKPINEIGSVLYETQKHGQPIVGDVVIVKEIDTDEGRELNGLSESEINEVLTIINRIYTRVILNAND